MLGTMFYLLFPKEIGAWEFSVSALGLGLLAIVLTFVMRFCVQYAFAMLAFWTERAHSVEQLWYLPYLFLSGLLIPLDALPEAMRDALMWTPFPYLIHFPSMALMGQLTAAEIARGYAMTLGWAVVFFAIYHVLWRAGLRTSSAMGA